MTLSAMDAADRANQLIGLTERLIQRLKAELEALDAGRPQDLAEGQAEAAELANIYRRESLRIQADPSLISGAPETLKSRLAQATRGFETLLQSHAVALKAASQLTEGLVKAIAAEVTRQRRPSAGYGAGARALNADARAVALDRQA